MEPPLFPGRFTASPSSLRLLAPRPAPFLPGVEIARCPVLCGSSVSADPHSIGRRRDPPHPGLSDLMGTTRWPSASTAVPNLDTQGDTVGKFAGQVCRTRNISSCSRVAPEFTNGISRGHHLRSCRRRSRRRGPHDGDKVARICGGRPHHPDRQRGHRFPGGRFVRRSCSRTPAWASSRASSPARRCC
jgi:hypothetical protein